MIITKKMLQQIMPNAEKNVKANPYTKYCTLDTVVSYFNQWATIFGVSTKRQWAYFLAQIAHESGELRYTEELASGAAYDTGSLAIKLGNTPAKDGDGQKYKGRGYIQLTGKANVKAYTDWCLKHGGTIDFLKNPTKLAELADASKSAFWFWWRNGLNRYADTGDFKGLTRRINGGYNGLSSREMYLKRAEKAIV